MSIYDKNSPFSTGISGCKWKCLVNNSIICMCNFFGQKINGELGGIIGNHWISIKDNFELASIEL